MLNALYSFMCCVFVFAMHICAYVITLFVCVTYVYMLSRCYLHIYTYHVYSHICLYMFISVM